MLEALEAEYEFDASEGVSQKIWGLVRGADPV